MDTPAILLMKHRRYETIPVDQIVVINSRLRNEKQFQMNVDSISNTGLMMPIRVNDNFLKETGKYELICGEGRLLAHRRLDRKAIEAEVVTCSRKEAYLQSLIENIARSKPGTMDYARELKRLHDEGWNYEQIGAVACRSGGYIRQYIALVEKGEDRLIKGVERGIFPISFAVLVAQSDDASIQNVMMDAFDKGIVNCENFAQARRIIATRLSRMIRDGRANGKKAADLTVKTLKQDISDVTKAKDSFVREAKSKENRFLTLLNAIDTLWRIDEFQRLIRSEELADRPQLLGDYSYEERDDQRSGEIHNGN